MKWPWLIIIAIPSLSLQLRAASLLDASFDIGSGADGLVEQVTELTSGLVLICGNFTTFNGRNRSYIARLNSDGSVDMSFEAHPGYWVRHMSVQHDGKIVIGGYFTTVDDVPRKLIARLNEDGSLDRSFDPGSGADDIIAGGIDGNITPFVFWTEIQEDGKILLTGNFRKYNGRSSTGLARVNTDGTFDETFQVGGGLDSWGRVIKLSSNGQIYVGGWFNNYNNTTANRLARLNTNGTIDKTFNAYFGEASAVYSIVELSSGQLIAAGHARDATNDFKEVVRLNHDGSIDKSWKGSTNEKTETLLPLENGQLLLGGYFSQVNGEPRVGIGRLNEDGTLDHDFVSVIDNFVWTLAPGQNGTIYISGGFTAIDGISRRGVARLVLPETTSTNSPPKPTAPFLSDARVEESKFRVSLVSTPGLIYTLEGANDPAGPWSRFPSIRAVETSLNFEDSSLGTMKFYRVQVR